MTGTRDVRQDDDADTGDAFNDNGPPSPVWNDNGPPDEALGGPEGDDTGEDTPTPPPPPPARHEPAQAPQEADPS